MGCYKGFEEMRFEIKNLKELEDAVNLMDDSDRLSFNLDDESKYKQIVFRVTEKRITIHEVKEK